MTLYFHLDSSFISLVFNPSHQYTWRKPAFSWYRPLFPKSKKKQIILDHPLSPPDCGFFLHLFQYELFFLQDQ